MGKVHVHVILDGQYGSCGKGAYTAWLAQRDSTRPALALRTGGPNAGHSVRVSSPDGRRGVTALRHIPAAVVHPEPLLALPGAALIHTPTLLREIEELESYDISVRRRLRIDPLATVITHEHEKLEEDLRGKIGSTREGVGAAQCSKIARGAGYSPEVRLARDELALRPFMSDVPSLVHSTLDAARAGKTGGVHIEMTQGVGLGLHFGHYPFATSRDITPGQALSDCYISPSHPAVDVVVHMLARTYPIRVAGNSGPFGPPATLVGSASMNQAEDELSWDELSRRTRGYVERPEKTTVTRLPRRIAEWNGDLVLRSARLVRPQVGVLTFADYVWPGALHAALAVAGYAIGSVGYPTWRWPRAVLDELEALTARLWHDGAFSEYVRPFAAVGGDIQFVSWGFGAVVPTPAAFAGLAEGWL